MVKKTNQRVMLTLSKESTKMLDEVADLFGMTRNSAMQMMIVVFHRERMKK